MDDIKRLDIVAIELNSGNLHRSWLNHSIGSGDNNANAFGVDIFRDGQAVNLGGGSVQGYFRDPQGNNIAITTGNTISGNRAYVVLPQACYNYEGQFTLAIKVIGGGVTGTMRIVDGIVDNTNTGSAVAPTGTVPTYQEILAVYAQMQEDIEDYEAVVANQNDQINSLESALVQTLLYPNKANATELNVLYPIYVKAGDTVVLTTSDGTGLTPTKVEFCNKNGGVMDWWNVSGSTSPRTIIITSGVSDSYFVRFINGTAQNITVENKTSVYNPQPLFDNIDEEQYQQNTLIETNLVGDYFTMDNRYIDASTGKAESSNNYNCTDFIACKGGTIFKYKLHGSNGDCLVAKYTKKKVFSSVLLSGTNAIVTGTITIDADCFIRVSNRKASLPSPVFVCTSSYLMDVANTKMDKNIFRSITPYGTDFIGYGKNIFNKETITENYYVDTITGGLIAYQGWSATDYIPIYGNPIFYWKYVDSTGFYADTGNCYTAFYDSTKNFISGNVGKLQDMTIPANACWFRTSIDSYKMIKQTNTNEPYSLIYVYSMWASAPVNKFDYVPFSYALDSKIKDHEDIEEVQGALEYNGILNVPSYTKTEIDTVVEKVRELQTADTISFAFLTDLHNSNSGDVLNSNHHAIQSLFSIEDKIPLDYVVFGGDYVTNSSSTPTSVLDSQIQDLMKYITHIKTGTYMIRGNHDSNPFNASAPYTASDFFKNTEKFFEDKRIKMYTESLEKGLAYVDLDNLKIRLIFTNMTDTSAASTGFAVSNEQIAWFGGTALNFEDKEDRDEWSVIVFAHTYFVASSIIDVTVSTVMHNMLVNFKAGENYTYNGTTYDFSTQGAMSVLCAIVGHQHADKSAVVDGIQVIATMQTAEGGDEEADDGNTYVKVHDTADETAYDIFTINRSTKKIYATRFGVGADRDWTYT